jgi:alpha-beta hydrolase superfamily lysophospholipase
MKTFEMNWKTRDGIDIFAQGWEPDGQPRAVVCLVHGLGEHIGRYANVGAALTKAGYALLGFDQRGHGKSGGARGHAPAYENLMDDVEDLISQAGRRYPGLPRFLYGHSMGGNEVLNFGIRRKPSLAGVIATGSFLKLAFEPPASKVFLGRMMNNIAPGFTQASGLEAAALSRDQKVVDAYVKDPLVHDKISARMFVAVYDSGQWALEHAAEFPLPLLLMHGGADRITSAQASREFAQKGNKNITLHIWEEWYHEVHNETEQAEVFKMEIIWMDARLLAGK